MKKNKILIARTSLGDEIYAVGKDLNDGEMKLSDGRMATVSLVDFFFNRQDIEKVEESAEQKKFWKDFLDPEYVRSQLQKQSK